MPTKCGTPQSSTVRFTYGFTLAKSVTQHTYLSIQFSCKISWPFRVSHLFIFLVHCVHVWPERSYRVMQATKACSFSLSNQKNVVCSCHDEGNVEFWKNEVQLKNIFYGNHLKSSIIMNSVNESVLVCFSQNYCQTDSFTYNLLVIGHKLKEYSSSKDWLLYHIFSLDSVEDQLM